MTAKDETTKKSVYWGITQHDETLFEGTHEQCWQELGKRFPNATISALHTDGIKISRIK